MKHWRKSQKINLLNEEQDRIDGQRESERSMIITVFGLVSIVSAALQMLDLAGETFDDTSRPEQGLFVLILRVKKKRNQRDKRIL